MKKQNRLLSLILSLFLLLFTLVPQSALTVKAEGNSEMAVHFIDVGQGNAILVQSGGQNLLYDGGDQSHADLIISYLQEQNVENIDYMIASHYDEDHIGGLVPCIDNFSVSNIFGPDYVHTSNLFNNFMNTATANAIIVQYPSVGETFDFGTGSFTVLAPNGISQNSNDNSLVIKLENGSNSFIFTGDAEETSEQDMISTGMNQFFYRRWGINALQVKAYGPTWKCSEPITAIEAKSIHDGVLQNFYDSIFCAAPCPSFCWRSFPCHDSLC